MGLRLLPRDFQQAFRVAGLHARTSANMAALLACSQGATTDVKSSKAPYCSVYGFKLPGCPLGERVDAPVAEKPSHLALVHRQETIMFRKLAFTTGSGLPARKPCAWHCCHEAYHAQGI